VNDERTDRCRFDTEAKGNQSLFNPNVPREDLVEPLNFPELRAVRVGDRMGTRSGATLNEKFCSGARLQGFAAYDVQPARTDRRLELRPASRRWKMLVIECHRHAWRRGEHLR
jgi:hypothetical protein